MADYKEKRMAERFAVAANVTCSFASPVLEDFGPVKIKNVSLTGVGLITPQVLDPGILLAIKLVNPAKNFTKHGHRLRARGPCHADLGRNISGRRQPGNAPDLRRAVHVGHVAHLLFP